MNPHISTYGLVGYPVAHSLSPLMHNAAFRALDVEATYELFSLERDALESFFQKLHDDDSPIFGLNVTVPYKETVIPFMDCLTPFVEQVQAVNTVVISKDRKLTGYNTDGPGFLAHIAELGVNTDDKRICIIGAGGAARAILASVCLIEHRPRHIHLFDIDREKANRLLTDLSERLDTSIASCVPSIDDCQIPDADILVNCTPVGMKPKDQALFEAELIQPGMFVYDLIYNPAETKLLQMAKARGAQTANGLGMLYYQGVLAFQHWADMQLPDEVKNEMRQALEEGLKKRG